MDIETMHQKVLLRLNQVGAYDNRDFIPGEIDEYLNDAILLFIKNIINASTKRRGEGVDSSPKRIADLNPLIKSVEQDAFYKGSVKGFHIDYIERPSDYLFHISLGSIGLDKGPISTTTESGKQTRNVSSPTQSYTANAKYIPHDDVYSVLSDPFNKPSTKLVLYNEIEEGFGIYTPDNCVVDTGLITYIKTPATVKYDVDTPANNVDCDLPSQTHPEIVAIATKSMLSDTDDLGKQQKLINLNETE